MMTANRAEGRGIVADDIRPSNYDAVSIQSRQVKTSDNRFQLLVEDTREYAIMMLDPRGIVTSWNGGAQCLKGYRADEIIGKHFSCFYAPEDADTLRRELEIASREGECIYEGWHFRQDSTRFLATVTISVLHDARGEVCGFAKIVRDMTRQRLSEKTLLRLNAQLEQRVAEQTSEIRRKSAYNRRLIETSPDPLVTIGPDGTITDVNAATEHVIGCRREELIGADFSSFFSEPARAKAGYEQVFREGLVRDYALEIQHKDGQVIPVLYNATVYRDETGQVQGVFAAARDITELRKAETALKEANDTLERRVAARTAELAKREEWLRVTLGSIGDAVISCDIDGRVIFLNPICASLIGWDAEEAKGQSITQVCQLINDQTGEPAEDLVARVLRENCMLEFANNTALISRDGRIIPIEDSAAPITDADGQVTGVVIVFHDVTAKRHAEETRARLASFPQWDPDPIVEADLSGHIQYCNPVAQRLFPHLETEGTAHPWLVEWAAIASAFAADEQTVIGREVFVGDTCYQQTIHYYAPSRRVRIYGLNITARKKAEEALQRTAEELARSNQELEQFAYVASHDLQEPLRAVAGYVSLLESRLGDQLDEKSRQNMAGAIQGTTRMRQLISDLLTLSRVGSQGKTFMPTDLNTVLDKVLQNIHVSIQESGATITYDPLPTLAVDGGQQTQLFQNLLGNAIKFRGALPPTIHVGARRQDNGWLFFVRDNGIGIDPQYRERIFHIFQRLHTRTEYPGTGIGLAICKKIVDRHGGIIWVESQPGNGSTFYFTIPQ
jgi:PAS domain S-box-containing protein